MTAQPVEPMSLGMAETGFGHPGVSALGIQNQRWTLIFRKFINRYFKDEYIVVEKKKALTVGKEIREAQNKSNVRRCNSKKGEHLNNRLKK